MTSPASITDHQELPKGYSARRISGFVQAWQGAHGAERRNKDTFFLEFCDALDVPRPRPNDPEYGFEQPVRALRADAGEGAAESTQFIDFYRKDCFVIEAKQGGKRGESHGTAVRGTREYEVVMVAAWKQALRYANALPSRPPLLMTVDIGDAFHVWTAFDGNYGGYKAARTFQLADLADPEVFQFFRQAFLDPQALDPRRRAERVTQEAAATFAALARSLEAAGHHSARVAHFLMRVLFTLFAEDLGLLPRKPFRTLLRTSWLADPRSFVPDVKQLWDAMNTGGHFPGAGKVWRFNGSLFEGREAYALDAEQLGILAQAAEYDWSHVEPSIFGTLFERALSEAERHRLGAHYTPRAYIERLVRKVVEEPLRHEWEAIQAELQGLLEAAAALPETTEAERQAKIAAKVKYEERALAQLHAFQRRLASVRVLDPACGSGNFLYVTLDLLKGLEREVLGRLDDVRKTRVEKLQLEGVSVTPGQLYGIERNPWARDLAQLVLWIGYLQWQNRLGLLRHPVEPILQSLKRNIRLEDAALAWDATEPDVDPATGAPRVRWDGVTTKVHPVTGRDVPDAEAVVPAERYLGARPAEWPAVDYIVGNPPFIGAGPMRASLGDGYVEALRKAYKGKVPESADLVMFWWYKAAEIARTGKVRRFGFITTNSLTQTFNRKVVEAATTADPPLKLVWAIPDHPWIDSADGAAVRIAMTCGAPCEDPEAPVLEQVVRETRSGTDALDLELASEPVERIHPDLASGAAVHEAVALKANAGLASPGVKLHGAGFIVTREEATAWGWDPADPGPRALARVVKPYANGKDLTARSRDVLVIDFFGLTEEEARAYGPAYQRVVDRVKPERMVNPRAGRRGNWWLFGENNPRLRAALGGLRRYIVTPETAKHRVFQFLGGEVLPDNMLVVLPADDAVRLGVLSSRLHVAWALATGGRLGVGNDPRYNKTRCFDTFPFPDPPSSLSTEIGAIAERLDAWRKDRLAAVPKLTLTELYNLMELRRAGAPLSEKQRQLHELACTDVLLDLHQALDRAVLAAYGWPADLPDAQIVERLLLLNRQRAVEESGGQVRWLRPDVQAAGAAVPVVDAAEATAIVPKTAAPAAAPERLPWPKDVLDQLAAISRIVRSGTRVWTAEEIRSCFKHARIETIVKRLEALEAVGALLRDVPLRADGDLEGWAARRGA